MQQITIIGNLTKDVDTRSTQSGKTVSTFTVAVDRKFKDASGKTITDYFVVHAWNKLGEACSRYLSKGRKVYVSGELQARTYEAKDGTTRMSLDVQADEVEFLSPKQQGEAHEEAAPDANGFTDIQSSEIPF